MNSDNNDITHSINPMEHIALRALDLVREAAFLMDDNGCFQYVNQEACRSLGYSRDELLGMSIPDIDPDYPLENLPLSFNLLLASGFRTLETRHRTKDGRLFPVEITSSRFEHDGSQYTLALARDISERRSIEESLLKSERSYRTLAENSPDNIVRYDRECRAIYCNPALRRTVILDFEQMFGKTPVELGAGSPEISTEYENRIRMVLESGEPNDMELIMPHPGGEFHTHLVRFAAERDEEGAIVGVLAIGRDITERKRAEEALQESETRFRQLADSAPVMVWMSDQDKLCSYFNKQWLDFTGRNLEQESGNGWAEGVHPEDLDRCFAIYVTSFDERKPFSMEYRLRASTGEYRWILDNGAPRFSGDGEFLGYIGACTDFTEHKRAEQELREKQQRLSDLTVELSLAEDRERRRIAASLHDNIGQDLTLARIKLGMLAKAPLTDDGTKLLDDAHKIINGIITSVRSLTHQISPPILESSSLETALKWLGRQMETDYNLQVLFHDDLCEKVVSKEIRSELYFTARELLINVAKHAKTERARISVGRENDRIVITIEDGGIGFDPGFIDLTGNCGGFGLFNIRRRIIYLGGTFEIESTTGTGTQVTIGMPLARSNLE